MKIQVKIQNNTYEVSIADMNARPIKAVVDGETFEVWLEENPQPSTSPAQASETISFVEQAPTEQPANTSDEITAPIPGVIIEISAKVGDTVGFGQELCILEAMKMKNSIRSNREGQIVDIPITVGDQVQHGQVLIKFKED